MLGFSDSGDGFREVPDVSETLVRIREPAEAGAKTHTGCELRPPLPIERIRLPPVQSFFGTILLSTAGIPVIEFANLR